MHTGNSILMRAPRETIFETVSDLEQWPRLLPHYRYIRYLERGRPTSDGLTRHVVVMAARRGRLPISWTSEQIIDRSRLEIRFRHLQAFTKGMLVVWTFTDAPAGEGVRVEIRHDLRFRVPALAPLAEPIIGKFFIEPVANQTLRTFKAYLEGGSPAPGDAGASASVASAPTRSASSPL